MRILLLLNLFFIPLVNGLNLGAINVYSNLNQPLYAEIEIKDLGNVALNDLKISVASDKDFSAFNIKKRENLDNILTFRTINKNNRNWIIAETATPLENPYLDFLMNVAWPDSSILKQYTILLDPNNRVPFSEQTKTLLSPRIQPEQENINDISLQAIQFFKQVVENEVTVRQQMLTKVDNIESFNTKQIEKIKILEDNMRNIAQNMANLDKELFHKNIIEIALVLLIAMNWLIQKRASFKSFFRKKEPQIFSSSADEALIQEDEIASKLDLATMYVNMGDEKSAKEILEQVLEQGNYVQKMEANHLLARFANG